MVESDVVGQIQFETQIDMAEMKIRSLKIKRWLRTNEVALYLGTSEGAIRNMVLRGQLHPKKLFRRNFFDKDAIDKLIEGSFSEKTERRKLQWR